MALLLLITKFFTHTSSQNLECSDSCNLKRGDSYCDLECNNQICNFDSSSGQIISSDCIYSCLDSNCTLSLLLNRNCDDECNSAECGYDAGFCSPCSKSCQESMLSNSVCDEACNTLSCNYDNFNCPICGANCTLSKLNSSKCESDCAEESCKGFEANKCFSPCAPGCSESKLLNGICDEACNNEDCGFDNGDCMCAEGCSDELLNQNGCSDNNPCLPESCFFNAGQCGDCALGCFESMIGDGECQSSCNVSACEYDYFDCGCAENCSLTYDGSEWKGFEDNAENEKCLVSACLYLAGGGDDEFLIRRNILDDIIYQDWKFREGVTLPDNCSENQLRAYDNISYSQLCNKDDPCFNQSSSWCMGRNEYLQTTCLRSSSEKCLICPGYMVLDECHSLLTECPSGYIYNSKISNLFSGQSSTLNWCSPDPSSFSFNINSPHTLFVSSNTETSSSGTGTELDPFNSLYYCFTKIYSSYTLIKLQPGELTYIIDESLHLVLRNDKFDPINFKTDRPLVQLKIEGNEDKGSIVKWRGKLKISSGSYQKIFIKNIKFSGSQVLRQDCDETTDLCYYCPQIMNKEYSINDKFEKINEEYKTYYENNCETFEDLDLFVFNKDANLQNVTFYKFRFQFNSLISANGNLRLDFVNFTEIQPKDSGLVLNLKGQNTKNNFFYQGGVIEDMNYGYEDGQMTKSGNFLKVEMFHSVKMENLEFMFNFGILLTDDAYLLKFLNLYGEIHITSCAFKNIYVDNLIIIDSSALEYKDLEINYKGASVSHSRTHVKIENCSFDSIYAKVDLINYTSKNIIQNIKLNDIYMNKVASSYFFSLEHKGEKVLESSIRISKDSFAYFPIKHLNITNINIKDSLFKRSGFWIQGYPSIFIDSLQMIDIDSDYGSIINKIIENFIENKKYLSMSSRQTTSQSYGSALQLSSSLNLSISSCIFKNIDYQVFQIDNIKTEARLANISISYINIKISNQYVISVDSSSSSFTIDELFLNFATNSFGGIILIQNLQELMLSNSIINDLSSNLSPFIVKNIENISINYLKMFRSDTAQDNGGCLSINSLPNQSILLVSNSIFSDCSSDDYGGCVYIGGSSEMLINFVGIELNSCNSRSVAALYVSNEASLVENSSFTDIVIKNSITSSKYLVSFNHKSGLISLNNWTVYNSTVGVIYCEFISDSLLLRISNMTIDSIEANLYILTFSSNSFSSIVLNDVKIKNSISEYLFMINTVNVNINISNLELQNNSAGIFATDHSNVSILSSSFIAMGIGIKLSRKTQLFCSDIKFSSIVRSVLQSSDSSFNISKSLITQNKANYFNMPLILVESSGQISTFHRCSITQNEAKYSELFLAVNANLKLKFTQFKENIAKGDFSPGIYVMQSKLTVENSEFSNQASDRESGFIHSADTSEVYIKDSSFKNVFSSLNAGAVYAYDSMLSIESSTFYNCRSSIYGGAIYLVSSILNMKSTYMSNNSAVQGSNIFALSSKVQISSTTFNSSYSETSLSSCSVSFSESKILLIDSSVFIRGSELMSAICVEGECESTLSNSIIQGFNCSSGVVSVKSGVSLSMKNVSIHNNTCKNEGGGLYSEDSQISILSSVISSNQASKGAGIFFQSSKCSSCKLRLSSATKIFKNSAILEGGGVMWLDNEPQVSDDCQIYNNSASYGSDLASIGSKLFPSMLSRHPTSISYQYEMNEVSPGQLYLNTFKIGIYDNYDNLVTSDNSSQLTINSIPEFPNLEIKGSSTFKSTNGWFELTGFIPYAEPGSSHVFQATSSLQQSVQPESNSSSPASVFIKINFRQCEAGEEIEENMCKVCPEFQYLLKAAKKCKVCPTGGICTGGKSLFPDEGYYRPSELSERIYKCKYDDTCEGNSSGAMTKCKQGYAGIKCENCDKGYIKAPTGRCRKCADRNYEGYLIIAALSGLGFGSYWLSSSALTSALDGKLHYTAYMKLFLDFLHMNYFLSLLRLNWPSYMQNFLDLFRFPETAIDFVFSSECFLYESDENYAENAYYYRLAGVISIPFAIYAIGGIVWLGFGFLHETYDYIKRELFLTFFTVFFIFYPNFILACLNHLACEKIDTLGSFLISQSNIECWTPRHKKYSLMFALPGIIIWGLTIPVLCLIIVLKRQRFLNNIENRVSLGFFLIGYRKHMFYWEFMVILRKVSFMFILVFLSQVSIFVQGLTISCILLFFVFLQFENFPFSSATSSHLQTELLSTVTISLFTGLYYMTGDLNWASRIFLFSMVAVLNIYFMCLWLLCVGYSIIEFFLARIPRLKEVLKKGDAYFEDFNKEELKRKGLMVDPSDGEIVYTFLQQSSLKHDYLQSKNLKQLFSTILLKTNENEDLSDELPSEVITEHNSLDEIDEADLLDLKDLNGAAHSKQASLPDFNENPVPKEEKNIVVPDEFQESDEERTEKNKEKNLSNEKIKYFNQKPHKIKKSKKHS